jgi:DHA1 family tetracycline resistance protein-like MFS transporter
VLALVGVCSTIVSAAVIGPAVARLGERGALLTGLVFGATGFLIYGLAPRGSLFTIGVPVMAFWSLIGPSAQSLMSHCVAPNEQGRLQGALSSLRGITGMIGPLLYTQVFAASIGPFKNLGLPGSPYLTSSALLITGLILSVRVTRRPSRAATAAAETSA